MVGKRYPRSPLFDGLDAAALEAIYARMRPHHFDAGEVICREGEPGGTLFVIERGLAQVLVGPTDRPLRVARLRRGDIVGEMSLLTGEPRSATVVAALPTELLELTREGFAAALARQPAMLANLSRILSLRLARANEMSSGSRRRGEAVALISGPGSASLASRVFLATEAASPHRVVRLDLPASPDGGESPVERHLAALDDLLVDHATVVVVVDSEREEVPLLLAQMDRALALADEAGVGRLVEITQAAPVPVEVALLTDDPRRAPSLVAGLPVIRACDRREPARDVAWLGRHLARTKLGLALGAGGAKGYAHVATLQVLEEAGYTIDFIAGSSIGAMVGSWHGLGRDAAGVESTMRGAFTPENVAAMFKLSLSGLSSGLDVVTRVYRETTDDRTFADLTIPLTMMCVDLDRQEPAPIEAGPLWEGLLAATALPGMFPPHQHNGRRLVDGLALVPVPTDAARAAGADIVVAVNIMNRETLPTWPGEPPPAAPARSGSRMLDTLLQVMDLTQLDASIRHAALADVTITPRFGPATWRDFHLADLFLAAGRTAAEEQLATLRALARPQALVPESRGGRHGAATVHV